MLLAPLCWPAVRCPRATFAWLAARAAADDVAVTLETYPGAPHVFQGFSAIADEAVTTLDHLAAFVRTHLKECRE